MEIQLKTQGTNVDKIMIKSALLCNSNTDKYFSICLVLDSAVSILPAASSYYHSEFHTGLF